MRGRWRSDCLAQIEVMRVRPWSQYLDFLNTCMELCSEIAAMRGVSAKWILYCSLSNVACNPSISLRSDRSLSSFVPMNDQFQPAPADGGEGDDPLLVVSYPSGRGNQYPP